VYIGSFVTFVTMILLGTVKVSTREENCAGERFSDVIIIPDASPMLLLLRIIVPKTARC
jgi:hypothetical protein